MKYALIVKEKNGKNWFRIKIQTVFWKMFKKKYIVRSWFCLFVDLILLHSEFFFKLKIIKWTNFAYLFVKKFSYKF